MEGGESRQLVDKLTLRIFPTRVAMGAAAAAEVATRMRQLLATQDSIRMVFASAPSQNEFLRSLVAESGIDWSRVTAFHMDEYLNLHADSIDQSFGQFLRTKLFEQVPIGLVHYINWRTSASDAKSECLRYSALLNLAPIDIICLGIGENGHIAFNDPPVADFDDPLTVKVVDLDARCRQQQVNDGCFPTLDEVPRQALSMTVPALMSGNHLSCVVPGPTKTEAVTRMLKGQISTECPASVMRRHSDVVMYVDHAAAAGVVTVE